MRYRSLRIACLSVTGACLAACAVGPNFHRPAPPAVDRYTAADLPSTTVSAPGSGGAAQRFLAGKDVPRNWWKSLGSAELDALIEESMRANPSVQAAQAALRAAMETAKAQRGAFFPAVQAGAGAMRQRNAIGVLSPTLASGDAIFNLYTAQVNVTYVPDVFGANRRQVESLDAIAEANRFQLDATYLTLIANLVTAAIQEAGFRAQIAATERLIGLERDALAVLRHASELGSIAEADVYAQEATLAQLETTLPPLRRQLDQTHDLLAALSGRFPSEFAPVHFDLEKLTLPAELPLGVPSELVERRPDVRAAEAQLHAACAQDGVAIANLLPQFTITGAAGSTATMMSDLFRTGTRFWSAGATLTQTLFAGGSLLHHKRAADAALDQAGAQYHAVVLTAFQNVADALHALTADAEAMASAARAATASEKSLSVARRQLSLGSISYLALINAEQTHQQSQIALAQARTNRFVDTVALFQALGGSVSLPVK